MMPAYEKSLEVTPNGPLKHGVPTAEVHLLPWTYKHLVAYLVETYAGGRVVLDKDTIADLARFKLRDEFVQPNGFVLTSKRISGPA